MRDVSANTLAAIQSTSGHRVIAKAKIDPSRSFFSALTDDYPYDSGDYSVPTDNPVGQCMLFSPTLGKTYTFVVDPTTGNIYGMEQGDDTKNDLSLTANADTKPTCWELGNGTCYLWFWDITNKLSRITIDLSDFSTSGSIDISVDYLPTDRTIVAGSPHALSKTQLVFTYQTSIGGIGVGYYDGIWKHWNQRFLSVSGITAIDWTIYTTAVLFENSIFVYSTDLNEGYVRGTNYNLYQNIWTDSFEAMPADLSRFCVFNAVNKGGFIHVSGQFHRTEDWANAKVYSLVVRSLDGFTFSWDRFTLLSTMGFQFQIAVTSGANDAYVYASDRNSVGIAEASFFFVTTPNSSIILGPPDDLVTVSVDSAMQATLDIKAHDEIYYDEDVVAKNNRVILYLGYEVEDGYEYIEYQRYIISQRTVIITEENKSLVLELTDMASWKTSQIAFPFYAEILSKTSFHDDCDLQDQTYPVQTVSPYMPEFLILDFWNNTTWDGDGTVNDGVEFQFRSSTGGCAFQSFHPAFYQGDTDKIKWRTVKLIDYHLLDAYPTVRAAGTCTARVYGWETADVWFIDQTPARPNSDWNCYIVTADPENLDDKTVTLGTLTSTYAKFPQYHPDDEVGSYPIEFSFSGLTEDHAVLYFGFTIENDTEGICTIGPERMEISGIDYLYTSAGTSQAWETSNPDKDLYSREFLKNPDTKIPSILFTMRPYSAFNFRISADFIYHAGDNPINVGRTCWGVVGLAEDGKDYIVARYHKQKSRVELLLVRSNNETVLAFYTLADADAIMMDHRDGYFRVWYRNGSTTWVGPVIQHHYNETANGKISMSSSNIMHTGVYTAIAPPGFLIPSYQMDKSDGIGMIASSDDSVLDAFPISGQVIINNQVYSYSGKTPRTNDYMGPWQGRRRLQDYWKTYRENGVTYTGHGVEVSAWFPDSEPYRYQNMLLSADRGRTWLITKSDWQVYDTTAGVKTLLPNRSRHYCPTLDGRSPITMDQRVNFVSGLLDIEPVGSSDPGYHLYGAWCALHGTDEIWVSNIEANTVTRDATVKDMVSMLCKSAGIQAEFPGDTIIGSLALSTTPQELLTEVPYLPGGFDVQFTIPALTSGDSIALYTGELFIGDPAGEELLDIGIKNDAGVLQVYSYPQDAVQDAEYINTVFAIKPYNVRILFHSTFCSIYLDNVWVHTFSYSKEDDITNDFNKVITWPDQEVKLYLHSNTTGYTATNILVTEMFDWREAIYVESETNAASALGSVIQERPIESTPTVNGGIAFSYFLVRNDVEYLPTMSTQMIERHLKTEGTVPSAGSDAIVIYTDVEFADNAQFAINEGFLTRVLKLGTLETGAKKTAIIMLRKAWERQFNHEVSLMPDIRLQVGDRFVFAYRLSGTGRYEQHSFIIEDLHLRIQEGSYEMGITGYRSTVQHLRTSLNGYMEGEAP